MKFYNLEGFLSRIGQNDRTSKLAIVMATALLFYTQASATPQISTRAFDIVKKYCEQSKNPNYPLTLSEVLSRSDLSSE